MADTQIVAKRFFVERVVAQARAERVVLSDAERRMLSWSEADPDYVVDPQLPEQLGSEISDEEYDKKISGLLARSFEADVANNPDAADRWRKASDVL